MKISVLDQSPARDGVSPDLAIRESIELAQACERFGYFRYWVSEHHSSEAVAGSAPEILMAAIAATTTKIRVGSAGVMLPHYAALKVAEQFRVLEAIAPGRIDLGVGRAPGSDGRTAMALNPDAAVAADRFPAMLRDLQAWSGGWPLPDNHPFRMVTAEPRGPFAPEVWVLGSSNYGAQVAAYFGLPYCFAYFFADGQGAEEALQIYRETYRPSERHPKPHSSVTVWAFAGRTQDEADYFYQSRAAARLMRDRGQFIALPSPEKAAAMAMTETERARMARVKDQALSGTAKDVADKIRALARELAVDELAITTTAYDPMARMRSYELLAAGLGLGAERLAA